jgi:hypothetical protein
MHLSSPPYVLHAPPISVFLIWSPEYRSTEFKAPYYVVFSIPLQPHSSSASSPPCSVCTEESVRIRGSFICFVTGLSFYG